MIIILIVLIACNLRAPITGVGALVNLIGEDLGLSSAAAGMLTTIPVLSFAAVSAATVFIAKKMGAGNLLLLSLIFVNVGIVIRSFFGNGGLFAGTLIIGLGLGVGNVLLPAVIKTYFPHRIPLMTSIYTAVMQIVSAVSTAVSVPIALHFGWSKALFLWFFLALFTLLFCIPNRRITISDGGRSAHENRGNRGKRSLYASPMTWWVTLYMGVQSMIFYSFIAWLSPIMQDKGYDPTEAGYILSVYVIMGIFGSCMLPVFMKKNKTQSATGIQLGVLYSLGMGLMIFGNSLPVLMMAISFCGFCSGTCISFAMALFGLHTSNGEDASRLSGIAQAVGYLIAAAGPTLLGKLHDISGSWIVPVTILLAAAVILIFLGKIAGRDEIIS